VRVRVCMSVNLSLTTDRLHPFVSVFSSDIQLAHIVNAHDYVQVL